MNTQAAFVQTGHIEKYAQSVRIVYKAFGSTHEAFIGARDIRALLTDRGAGAVDVCTVRDGIDGSVITERIGSAFRSRSGKALMIRTVHTAGGDLVSPFAAVEQVMAGRQAKARVSSMQAIGPAAVSSPDVNIRAGLSMGF